MRSLGVVLGAVMFAACSQNPGVSSGDDLPPFDPDAVVFADGCTPVPEAQACIEEFPVQFVDGDAPTIASRCEELGYTCCNTDLWISRDAASCIAETDDRMSTRQDNRVSLNVYDDVFGPMYDVYEFTEAGSLQGIGIHAATGRVTWFDDGSGVFS